MLIGRSRREELSVRRVRSVLAVVGHGSFSAAAQELGLTQPAVSQHVKQLEDQLGLPLLARDAEGIRLTSGGAALLPALRRFLAGNEAILDHLASINQGTRRIVRVASPASFAALHIAPVFKALRPDFPDHILDVSEIDDAEAFLKIRSGDIDLGISSVFTPSPGLTFAPLRQDGACVVLSADDPLSRAAVIDAETLIATPVVRFPIGTTSDDWLSAVAETVGRLPEVVAEVRQLVTGFQLVRQGLGVTLVPEDAARACLLPGLVAVPFADRSLVRTFGMVLNDSHVPSDFERRLIDGLRRG